MKENISIVRTKITRGHVGLDCFLPVYNSDFNYMKKCKYGKPLLCSSKRPRNPEHHKLIFAIAKCTIDNVLDDNQWAQQSPYDLIKAIMIKWGLVEWKLNLDGTLRPEAKSISFESMNEEEFEPVSHAVFTECAIILKLPVWELKENYVNYL